ncbi:MAG: acyl-[Bacteroidaceae bacterium]|nr:acyl-[acyl-carrier-protein] thioesterase [Bacteroidaceae bacterium]
MKQKLFTKTFTLTPGECNGQQEMSLSFLVGRIIKVASLHADSWGVGYEKMIASRTAWVLSRLSIEMKRFPAINENYTLETWIEDYNTRFSTRNMAILDSRGEVCGYARTIWLVLDLEARRTANMEELNELRTYVLDRPCPIDPPTRMRAEEGEKIDSFAVCYSDIDLNRHVNSARYVEYLLNQYPFEWFDNNRVARFEIAYAHEARPGIEIDVYREIKAEHDHTLELRHEGNTLCRSRIVFAPRTEPVRVPFNG